MTLFALAAGSHADRMVEVPVRARSSRGCPTGTSDSLVPAASIPSHGNPGPVFFNMDLPKTPFHAIKEGIDQPDAPLSEAPSTIARAMFSLGRGLPPPGSAAYTPPAGIPASTPMAAEVLTSLCGIKNTNEKLNGQNNARDTNVGGNRDPSTTVSVVISEALVPRRAAARRAAQTTAALLPIRPNLRQVPASGSHRGCNCKRSQCLKLYCECFAAGGFCMTGCTCQNCSNTEANLEIVNQARSIVLLKDPGAFDSKVSVEEGHRKGCRCKRSKCLKKYCECFSAGVQCNADVCQCISCMNGPHVGPAIRVSNQRYIDIELNEEDKSSQENYQPNVKVTGRGFNQPGMCDDAIKSAMVQPMPKEILQHGDTADEKYTLATPVNSRRPGPLSPRNFVESFPAYHQGHGKSVAVTGRQQGGSTAAATRETANALSYVYNNPFHADKNNSGLHPMQGLSMAGPPNAWIKAKRPRRAASGGVRGAIAAEASSWGLDDISPPLRRSTTALSREILSGSNTEARKERNEILRRALHGENTVCATKPSRAGPFQDLVASMPLNVFSEKTAEVDAIKALVNLNSVK